MENKTKRFLSLAFALLMVLMIVPQISLNAEAATTYEKATSIAVGDTMVLACDTKKMELSGMSSKYGNGAAYTDVLSGAYTLTVEAGSASGTYAFKTSDGQYLSWTSSNSLNVATTKNANASWAVTFDADDNAIILNAADNTRKLQWNASSPRFACYTSAQTAVQLYKLTEETGGSGTGCEHTEHNQAGECSACGEPVDHSYVNGACGCGATCAHADHNQDGKCTVCGIDCDHTPGAAATCTTAQTCTVCNKVLASGGHKVDNGYCTVCNERVESATLSFATTDNRTSLSNDAQVWEQNGVKLTNNKNESTNPVADYCKPARFYKGSGIVVESTGMSKIEFACNTDAYATTLQGSVTGAEVNGKVVTVAMDESADSFTVAALGGQVRVDSITVYYDHTHVYGDDDKCVCGDVCTHESHNTDGICAKCEKNVGHVYDDQTHLCECGAERPASGSINGGMVNIQDENRTFITIESWISYAKESIVVKVFDVDGNLLATSSLVDKNRVLLGNANFGLSTFVGINSTDEWWDLTWEKGHPRADVVPAKATLFVDGKEMNTADIKMRAAGSETEVKWAEVPGVACVLVGDKGYETFEAALDAVENGQTITVLNVESTAEAKVELDFSKPISFTITGNAPNYVLPVVTFANETTSDPIVVNIENANLTSPELDARQNATINVIDSTVLSSDKGNGNATLKSYYNGAINISGTSKVYWLQATTMGYINVEDSAELNVAWQTNVYGNGLVTVKDSATFNTAALHLTGEDYKDRDNTDADRVGKPAAIVVDGATLNVGKVLSENGADYSYNSKKGINIGTIAGKSAVLDIKKGAKVNIYMANGETANIGAGGTVNVNGSTFNVACRSENGTATLANNGTILVSGASDIAASKVTGSGWVYMNGVTLDADTNLIGAKVGFINGTNTIVGSTIDDGWFSVGIGQNAAAETTAAFAAANGITLGDVTVNVSGDAVIGAGGSAYNGWVGSAYSADKTQHKYTLNIENSQGSFGYLHVSADGAMNVKGHTNNKVTTDNANVDFYAGELIINGTVTFDSSDAWVKFTKMSVDSEGGILNITNGSNYEASIHNGGNSSTSLRFWKKGTINVNGAVLVVDNGTTFVDGAALNVANATVTMSGNLTGSADITVDATGIEEGATVKVISTIEDTIKSMVTVNNKPAGTTVSYDDGDVTLTRATAVATIGEDRYFTLQAAVDAADDGDTITMIDNITEELVTINKTVTLDGDGKTLTGNVNLNGASLTDCTIRGQVIADGEVTLAGNNDISRLWITGDNAVATIPEGATLTVKTPYPGILIVGATETDGLATSYFTTTSTKGGKLIVKGTLNSEALGVFGNGELVVDGVINAPEFYTGKDAADTTSTAGKVTIAESGALQTIFCGLGGETNVAGTLTVKGAPGEHNFDAVMTVKPGAVLNVTGELVSNRGIAVEENATLNLASGSVKFEDLNENDSKFSGKLTNNGDINADITSSVTASSIAGDGNITIDATGLTGEVNVINLSSGEAPAVEVVGDAVATYGEDGVTLVPAVAKIGTTCYATLADAVAEAKSGDTITLFAGEYELPAFSNKELTFKGEDKDTVIINDAPNANSQDWVGSSFHFENLTAKGATAIYHGLANGVQTVTYKDCNVNNLRFLYAETVSFEDCAFNSGAQEHSFWTYGASNVTVTGCTFKYADRAVNCYSENGAEHETSISFSDCDFVYTGTSTNPEGAVEINSGSVKSISVDFDECTAPENGAMWFNSQWDSTGGEKTEVEVEDVKVWPIYVAQIGENGYITLEKAFNAAVADDTITLLDNIDLGETALEINKAVTLDVGGKTLTGKVVLAVEGAQLKAPETMKEYVSTSVADKKVGYDNAAGIYSVVNFTVAGANMTLGNDLALNFWVRKADLSGTGYTAIVTKGGTEKTVAMDEWTVVTYNGVDYFQIPFDGMAAKEMNDDVSVQIFKDGTAISNKFTESVVSYAQYMFANSNDTELHTMLVDMLNYGAAAQKEFNHNTGNLANSFLTAEQQDLATKEYDLEDTWTSGGIGYGSNLELKDNIILHIWFKNAGVNKAVITYTDHNGNSVETPVTSFATRMPGVSSVAVDTLVVADGYQLVTVEFYNGDTKVGTVTESIESYLNYMLSKDSDNALYDATAKFITSSYNYFH